MSLRETQRSDSLVLLDDETRGLLVRARNEPSPTAQNELRDQAVTLNMPFARRVASRYRSSGIEWDDLVQVAYVALIKAVVRFDPETPYRFSAYATATVRGEIKRWLRDHDWVVRPPRRYQNLRLVVTQRESDLAQTLGGTPRPDVLAAELGVSTRELRESAVACQGRRSLSLDAPMFDSSRTTLGEGVPDPGDDFDTLEWSLTLRDSLAKLDDRAKLILRMRFENEATQAEIGAELGVSQMHVSRLLSRLLEQLRADLQVAA